MSVAEDDRRLVGIVRLGDIIAVGRPQTGQAVHLVPEDIVDAHPQTARDAAGGRSRHIGQRRLTQREALKFFRRVSAAQRLAAHLPVRSPHDIAINGHGVAFVGIRQRLCQFQECMLLIARQRDGLSRHLTRIGGVWHCYSDVSNILYRRRQHHEFADLNTGNGSTISLKHIRALA